MAYITPNLVSYGDSNNDRSSIGHAMYNYITPLILSNKFKLEFIHQSFRNDCARFEDIIGLNSLFKSRDSINCNIVKIPLIEFGHTAVEPEVVLKNGLDFVKKYIDEHNDNTLFVMSGPGSQFPGYLIRDAEFLTDTLSKAYWSNNSKINPLYDSQYTNVAVHIRRGDITQNVTVRWKDNNHYVNIIEKIKMKVPNAKFYIISEGAPSDFSEFGDDINLILNGSDIEAFYNLASADILVTGQSTFSTIISYINTGKIVYTPCLSFTLFENYSKRFIHFENIERDLIND